MRSVVAAGLLAGFLADRALGDPARHHPVAAFGTTAAAVERLTYRPTRLAGVLHVGILVGTTVLIGTRARQLGPRAELALTCVCTYYCLGGTTLSRTGRRMSDALAQGDLVSARAILPSLCGRDPSVLDRDGLARAALESIAENTSDAAVGVLFWGAVAGLPGVLGYRAVNTLDSMIGYRSDRYLHFGWCAARLDDVVNLVPARSTGALTVAVGGNPRGAITAWRRDARKHPSPNAGVAEASAAGTLGVMLGGRTEYSHGVELRPTLGTGPTPTPSDLSRAVDLSSRVQTAAAAVSVLLAVTVGHARTRRVGRRRGRGLLPTQ
ncbi:cobalamin biosynthesis protein CobD [Rhodococcoides trifolii]|uniref:Cobalamin biosynthesis protein CobD n=1 Tax=Rhodococcoides trifolii TaxID=908250 RepID=A0A917D2U5_9NOCA|nr:cobalamin biosynthesis protein [Rhodococcus trifolii]GGG04804.1 cobalamin biosynthesis protein CobD [Rhodococcus trifolii]